MSTQLEAEVRSLHSQLSRMRRLQWLTVLGFAAIALVAASRPARVVQASRFEIVDAAGEVRGTLEAEAAGATLKMLDGDGAVVWLRAMHGQTGLFMHTDGVMDGAAVALVADGTGSKFHLADAHHIPRVTLGASGEAEWVRAIDASGTVRAEMGSGGDRAQRVFVGDPHGGPTISLEAGEAGTQVDLD